MRLGRCAPAEVEAEDYAQASADQPVSAHREPSVHQSRDGAFLPRRAGRSRSGLSMTMRVLPVADMRDPHACNWAYGLLDPGIDPGTVASRRLRARERSTLPSSWSRIPTAPRIAKSYETIQATSYEDNR